MQLKIKEKFIQTTITDKENFTIGACKQNFSKTLKSDITN